MKKKNESLTWIYICKKRKKEKKHLRTDKGGGQKGYKKRVIFNLEGVKRNLELEDRMYFKSPDLDRSHTEIANLGVIKKQLREML